MEYILDSDYDNIMAKNGERFKRNDALFNEESGMAAEDIMLGIKKIADELKDQPHPIVKAKAFEYILKNTRISCDSRDRYPAINMIDRPLNSTIVSAWSSEVFGKIIPEVNKTRSYFESGAMSTMWPDYDHSVPNWDRLLSLGFSGILKESEEARLKQSELTPETAAFFDSIKITYEAILIFIGRLEEMAENQKAYRMAAAFENLKSKAPSSFYEALLFNYIYFMLSEHIEGLQVRSLSNFDRLFYPFYQNDLSKGVTETEIREDLAYFFLQFVSIGNYWNQPVYLGGCKENEETVINDFSYLFLDVYDKMGIFNPKIQIKIADSTPEPFILKALDMIRRGNNSIVFVSDSTIRKALTNFGLSEDDARTCDIKGCYEYSIRDAMHTSMNYVNLLKPVEFAMHEGHDGLNGNYYGLDCKKAEEYETFEEFYAEYKRQLGYVIDTVMKTVNIYEDYLDYINPQPMLSATYENCIKTGRDALGGGAKYNQTSMSFGFMADAADSLVNIKKYVFDKKILSLGELRDILDSNYDGNEKLRRILLSDPDKYGNNKELPDSIVCDIVDYICSKVCRKPNSKRRGGEWTSGFHVARMSYHWSHKTASSASGRLLGEELSKNMSASMGMNREGATAAILSITKVDASKFTNDASLDLGLLPSAVQGDDGVMAMYALLKTFIMRGGHAMHINVFNADTLRKAQQEPEKYSDLQIRVCGWNVLWNNINKVEQDGFIKQAESLV